jgi:hypothetical protein
MGKFQRMSGTSRMSTLPSTHGTVRCLSLPGNELIYLEILRATFRVYKIERQIRGVGDLTFLKVMFLKLMINFTWVRWLRFIKYREFDVSLQWVNRKDRDGKNVFEGGFLGLDNIGAFNRSEPLPNGGVLRQADGTAWMAFYCLNM